MSKPKDKAPMYEVKIEPGADKRLSGMLKKVLNTPPKHVTQPTQKPKTGKRER